MAVVSIIVPAHNEANVVERCLAPLAALAADGRADVVVVANGCTDDTAAVARKFSGVRALDLETASKAAALNAGDAATDVFPRIYLDADIVVDAATVLALVDVLSVTPPCVASPRVRFDLTGRPWAVRAFYAAYQVMPYVASGLIGLGLYAMNESGRARFDVFPDVTSDDLFVQRNFAADERVILGTHSFSVDAPRTLAALVKVRTRTAYGNSELRDYRAEFAATTKGSTGGLADAVRAQWTLAPAAAVYVMVTAVARLRAKRASRSPRGWERDDTTR